MSSIVAKQSGRDACGRLGLEFRDVVVGRGPQVHDHQAPPSHHVGVAVVQALEQPLLQLLAILFAVAGARRGGAKVR